ncbi:hypothetical protein GBF38_014441, partial [Nibea albiflora]
VSLLSGPGRMGMLTWSRVEQGSNVKRQKRTTEDSIHVQGVTGCQWCNNDYLPLPKTKLLQFSNDSVPKSSSIVRSAE